MPDRRSIARGAAVVALLGAAGCKASPPPQPPPAEGHKRLEVSPAQARSWGLPPVAFSFDYPATAELALAQPGRRNEFYAMVTTYDKGDRMVESVTLCHVDLRGGPASAWGALAPTVIARLQDALRRQNATSTFDGTGEASFDGRRLHQFGFALEIKDPRQGAGRYRGLWVARLPEAGDRSENGVTFTMNLREGSGSEVKAREDFATKGLPGQIWRSFRFAR
jgi:hypothetical protein